MIWCSEVLWASLHVIFMDLPVLRPYSQLQHPLILLLSSTVTALWLWPWLTASRHIGTMCVCVCECRHLRVWTWDCWNITPLYSTVEYSMSVKCRPEVRDRKEECLVIIHVVCPYTNNKQKIHAKSQPSLPVQFLYVCRNTLNLARKLGEKDLREKTRKGWGGEQNCPPSSALHSNWIELAVSENNNSLVFGRNYRPHAETKMEITHNEYISMYVVIILIIKANIMWCLLAWIIYSVLNRPSEALWLLSTSSVCRFRNNSRQMSGLNEWSDQQSYRENKTWTHTQARHK